MMLTATKALRLALAIAAVGIATGTLVEWELNLSPLLNAPINSAQESVDFLQPSGHRGGFFKINGTAEGRLFYFYFQNRHNDPNAPLLLWSNGGPGCSSMYGLFIENGPYKIAEDLSLFWNPYGWDIGHNILFVDYPFGVGYSHGSDGDKVTKEEQLAEHMLQFFYAFFEVHPELTTKPLYLSGESYAGHYLPFVATRILAANEVRGKTMINLAGMALGDPWINPSLQFRSYPFYEYEMGLIDEMQRDNLLSTWKFCDNDMQLCNPTKPDFSELVCQIGYDFCNEVLFYPILLQYPGINYYDLRAECLVDGCYNVTNLNAFMNLPLVKERFHISPEFEWKDCSDPVYFDLLWDGALDTTPLVEHLLEKGIKTLIYTGDQDLICNYIGVRDSVDAMKWSGANDWQQTVERIWAVHDNTAGSLKTTGLLTYLKVFDCGHMVPFDQPVSALEMIQTFTSSNKTWETVETVTMASSFRHSSMSLVV